MRAETVKRMILLSVENPPEDLEELLELHARLWSQENGKGREPVRAAEERTERVIEPTKSVPERTESVIEPEESVPEAEEDPEEGKKKRSRDAIRGFAFLRCDHCGKELAFSSKSWISRYKCRSCGGETWLHGRVRTAIANCECGNRSVYSTNVEEGAFDIPCVVCGAPMPVVWIPGRDRYEPAVTAAPGRHGRKK